MWCVHPVVLGAVRCCVLCDVMFVDTMYLLPFQGGGADKQSLFLF